MLTVVGVKRFKNWIVCVGSAAWIFAPRERSEILVGRTMCWT